MALPGVTTTVLDGGLGITTPATSRPHVVGVFESGTQNLPTLVGNQRQLKELFGTQGPGNDMAGTILDQAGGPIVVTRVTPTVVATYGAASMISDLSPGADNEINLLVATSAPKNDYAMVAKIIVGGARTATTFQYSLDGGKTFSPTLAAAATVALGTSGVTFEFEVGTVAPFVAGATYVGTSKAPHYASADLTAVFAAADISALTWDFWAFAGEAATAAAAATLFATIGAAMNAYALPAKDRYYRAMMGAGEGTPASVVTAFAALTNVRVAVLQGKGRGPVSFGTVGRSIPHLPTVVYAAMRAAGNVMSTDLAATSGAASVGALAGVTEPSQNEFTQPAGLDDIRIGTLRTFANGPTGVLLTNVWLKGSPGTDFEFWQHGRIMDEACKVTSAQHALLLSSSVVCKADGSGQIVKFSALQIEKRVQRALDNVIGSALRGVGPTTLDGTGGHVSDVKYQVDLTNNVLSTKTLITTVSLVPRGYLKAIVTTLSFRLAA
jgi:hypothetical protein